MADTEVNDLGISVEYMIRELCKDKRLEPPVSRARRRLREVGERNAIEILRRLYNQKIPIRNLSGYIVWYTADQSRIHGSTGKSYSNTLKILTYNVCSWDLKLHERMEALGSLIELHTPDIICFQEVTLDIYKIFEKSSWWNAYDCSVTREEASELSFFCMQLCKLPVKFIEEPFRNPRMGRNLCIAEIQYFKYKSLIVATSHLVASRADDPHINSDERIDQAKEALNYLQSSQNAIFCGDMNWDDEVNGQIPLPRGWTDAWKKLRPSLEGYTYDTELNQMLSGNSWSMRMRLDRFLSKLKDFKLEKISMVGTEAIPGVRFLEGTLELPVYPSDHFGLLLEIDIVQLSSLASLYHNSC